MKLEEQVQDRIEETFAEINGACDAAWLIAETASAEAQRFCKINLMAEAAAGKLKEYTDSISFLLTLIQRSAGRFLSLIGDEDTYTPEYIKRLIGSSSLLKAARLEKGYTEEELAELIGVAPDAIQAYEVGDRVPRDEIKDKLAEALERPVQDLFF